LLKIRGDDAGKENVDLGAKSLDCADFAGVKSDFAVAKEFVSR
jgi:hypothetical protein